MSGHTSDAPSSHGLGAHELGAHKIGDDRPVGQTPSRPFEENYGRGLCDVTPGTASCFFDDKERGHQIEKFRMRVIAAGANYRNAITTVRVDKLLEKEKEVFWLANIMLEIVAGHLTAKIGNALKFYNAGGAPRSENNTLQRLRVSDDRLEKAVKGVFDVVKKGASNKLKRVRNEEPKSEQEDSTTFLAQLGQEADVAYQSFREYAPAGANDAELLVLIEGMDITNHSVEAYASAIREKLDRYKKSGVTEIGRRPTKSPALALDTVGNHVVDTRCVWVRTPGVRRTLYFESLDGAELRGAKRSDDPGFGAVSFPGVAPSLRQRVPAEFVDLAVARHEQTWGVSPDEIDGSSGVPVRRKGTAVAEIDRIIHDTFFGADEEAVA